jgi:diguanylate cyclase (GGDEF)-like protein/PAS domain S-box-containing protein
MDQTAHDFDLPESSFTIDHVSFGALVQALSCGVVVTHPAKPGNPIVFVNQAFCRMTGYAPAEVIGRDCNLLQGADTDRTVVAEIRAALNEGSGIRRKLLNYRKNGEAFWNELTIDPVRDAAGAVLGFIGIQNDVTELTIAALANHEFDSRLSNILDNVKGYILSLVMTRAGRVTYTYISGSFFRMLGLSDAPDYRDPDFLGFVSPLDRRAVEAALAQSARDLTPLKVEARVEAPGHAEVWVRSWSNVRREKNGDTVWDGFGMDITAEKRAEAQLHYLTFHDPLTNLPNRFRLEAAVEDALHDETRHDDPSALFFIDISAFHEVNETFGADNGDMIIREAAERLQQIAGPDAMVARIGGDEFAVLIGGVAIREAANRIAESICAELSRPIQLHPDRRAAPGPEDEPYHSTCNIEVCVGIADFPQGTAEMPAVAFADSVAEYLKRCDVALNEAKRLGRGRFCQYSPEIDHKVRDRMELRQSLHLAITRSEFLLHYQPIVDLRSGTIVGAEALLRWNHPRLGMQSPDRFIPFAEESGLIVPLGAWALETAMRQIVKWRKIFGLRKVAVNVSVRQIIEPGFLETVVHLLRKTGAPADMIDLELTEGMLLDFSPEMREQMSALRHLGLGISIDDFGTGYSSLKYLSTMPVDKIKIDRSFVRLMMHGTSDASIIKAVILLGQTLNLEIVAEGIETPEQQRFLIAQGCRWGQGYLFSKPIPAAEFADLLEQHRVSKPGMDVPYSELIANAEDC